jgi:hypothetical protein
MATWSFTPGTACETYNGHQRHQHHLCPTKCIERIVGLDSTFLALIPAVIWKVSSPASPISFREMNGIKSCSGQIVRTHQQHGNTPIYPVFPYGWYSVGKPDLKWPSNLEYGIENPEQNITQAGTRTIFSAPDWD